MRDHKTALRLASMLGACLLSVTAWATTTTYTSQASFLAAISALGTDHLSSFEGGSAPYAYADSAASGFSLSASVYDGVDVPTINSGLWTSSGTNFLGLDNGSQQFSNGDVLSFTLASGVRAFGLYLIAGRDVIAGDLTLDFGGGNSVTNGALADKTDGAGSYAYFLGLVSDTDLSLATLNIGAPADPNFLFNAAVDDVHVVYAAGTNDGGPGDGTLPEPSSVALIGIAAMAMFAANRRRTRARRNDQEKQA